MKTTYDITRSICKRYMREFTGTTTPPKLKVGFYAVVVRDTGDVWLSESNNLAFILNRFNSRPARANPKQSPMCLVEAHKRGAEMDLFILTRPEVFSAQQLESELFEAGVLLDRKAPTREGEGVLYSIVHQPTQSYFVCRTQGVGQTEEDVMRRYLDRLGKVNGEGYNQKIRDFVTEQASDILSGRNFTVHRVCLFANTEAAIAKQAEYIANRQGTCLNHHNN